MNDTTTGIAAVKTVDQPLDYAVIEHVVGTGDLSKLTTQQRVAYYKRTCETLGLNWLTRPMRFLSFQGQTVLYFTRDGCDQLRKVHNISLSVVNQANDDDMVIITARATMENGRHDEDIGAVALGSLRGEARANAMMKAITKAKRRVTLSICGLGMNEESEVETLRGAVTFDVEEDVKAAPATRPASAYVDAIEIRAQAATTPEDMDQLERDDDVRKVRENVPVGRPQRDRLETLLTVERARVVALMPGTAPDDDEDHIPDDLKDVDGDAIRCDKVIAAIAVSPSLEAIDKGILGTVAHTSWIDHLASSGRMDLINKITRASEVREDQLAAGQP